VNKRVKTQGLVSWVSRTARAESSEGLTAVQFAKRGIGMRGMTLLTNFFIRHDAGSHFAADPPR
jgi:hypothetical protein